MSTNAQIVEAVMAWAEARLGEPLGVALLARRAGYSLHHFSRLFSAHTGEAPAEWVEGRRVAQAQRLLLESSRKVLDVALACGFNDAATFTRAFRRRTGIIPSRFRASRPLELEDHRPRPSVPKGLVTASWIEPSPRFHLCGLVAEVRREAAVPGSLWARLLQELPRLGLQPRSLDFRQAAFWTEDAETCFTCLAGFVAEPQVSLPLPFVFAEIPAATGLVFQVPGPPDRIAPAYQEIYGSLLPELTWRPAHPFVFERYPRKDLTEIVLPVSPGVPGEPGGSGIA